MVKKKKTEKSKKAKVSKPKKISAAKLKKLKGGAVYRRNSYIPKSYPICSNV